MTEVLFPNDTHYSEHFTKAELACHCGCPTTPDEAQRLSVLAAHLEELRHAAGGYPLTVNDAKRCAAENARVGGAPHSQHMECRAADLSSAQHVPSELAWLANTVDAFHQGGIGTYDAEHGNFVHVDYRPNGPARWLNHG